MSEHQELIDQLSRVEKKLDLIMTAMTKLHGVDFQLECKDPYHRNHAMQHRPCRECGGYEARPVVKAPDNGEVA